jgi:nickel-dependent lactate racemase
MPDDTIVYAPQFPEPTASPRELVLAALEDPIGCDRLRELLGARRCGRVVVVVSDITRPVGYADFLGGMLAYVERAGVKREEVLILVATGMHRPSTRDELLRMFGADVVREYEIIDHVADDESMLAPVEGRSWSGNAVTLNRHFVEAGFRITTGLVEPHFMAGFSGGRKAVCPGLSSLSTLSRFHGYEMLSDPAARNANLDGNPCHLESLSIARLAGVDFTLNVALDTERRVVRAFAGDLEAAHDSACAFVRECSCPPVDREADLVVTSSGGLPLDATYYQCIKGLVSCLPAVKRGGTVLAVGGCEKGAGGPEFTGLLKTYEGAYDRFIEDIQTSDRFTKDQWQVQMQCSVVTRVGGRNVHFITAGLDAALAARLPFDARVTPAADVQCIAQETLDGLLTRATAVAAIPDGPYCAPVVKA